MVAAEDFHTECFCTARIVPWGLVADLLAASPNLVESFASPQGHGVLSDFFEKIWIRCLIFADLLCRSGHLQRKQFETPILKGTVSCWCPQRELH